MQETNQGIRQGRGRKPKEGGGKAASAPSMRSIEGWVEAERRIRKALETGATRLDLSFLGLEDVPEALGEVKGLESLDLMNNQLTEVPDVVLGLTRLRTLDLYGNNIVRLPGGLALLERIEWLDIHGNSFEGLWQPVLERLPALTKLSVSALAQCPQLGRLQRLRSLNIMGAALRELPEAVLDLEELTSLVASYNRLTELPEAMSRLLKLESINLNSNQLKAIPETILKLPELQYLDVSSNRIGALPHDIGRFRKLMILRAKGNNIHDLPHLIVELPLEQLDLDDNPLVDCGHVAFGVSTLRWLSLASTHLTTIPSTVGNLRALKFLRLRSNAIRALPPELRKLEKLGVLDLSGNPLPVPPEVLEQYRDPAAILRAYFTEARRRINEAKLLLVGQGAVGKTSLIKRLLQGTFDPDEDATHGIARHRWTVPIDDEDVRVNVWDFGGQEIMHATHQFFLTKRSVYVVVVDGRVDEQENRIEYWLKLVQSYGEGSPVVIVCNKCDQHRLELARRRLQEKYPTLAGFYETSCKTGEGIGALRDALHALIDRLPHVRDTLPEPWFEVKSALEQMAESYVSLGRFQEICAGKGVEAASEQRTLLRLCHDLGTVLSFQDDPRLQDTNVLRPDWVTEGVYKILNWNELFQAKGVLDLRRLGELLDPGAYPRGTHPFLIDMMRKFEICFPFAGAGAEERYLVPALLPKDEPFTGSWDDAIITFEYHYDVLPPSVISRFLVRMHENISQKTSWRSGAVLADGDDRAFVRADATDGTVEIRVRGSAFSARTFLGKIRGNLEVVQGPPLNLQVSAKVVVMAEGKRVAVDYDDLVRHEEEGIETILVPGTRTKANVSDLLNGVRTPEERLRRVRHIDPMELDPPRAPEQEPLKVRSDEPAPEPEKPLPRPPSAWVNGSFYLVVVIVVLAAVATIAHVLSLGAALAVSTVALLCVGVIGANQLKHDDRLKDRSYLALMGMAYKNLPLLQGLKRGPTGKPSLPAGKTAAPKTPKLPEQKPAPALPKATKKARTPKKVRG